MNFKNYLKINEAILGVSDIDIIEVAKEMMEIIKSENLSKRKVIWRGSKGPINPISYVTNTRSGFYGSMSYPAKVIIQDYLKVKNPTFATTDFTQTTMFGTPYIFLPKKNDNLFNSLLIRDIVSGTDINQTDPEYFENKAALYTKSTIKNFRGINEIIVDTKGYYLVHYKSFIKQFKNKYFKPQKEKDLTYGDLNEALKSFINYKEWMIKNGYSKSYEQNKEETKKQAKKVQDLKDEMRSPKKTKERYKIFIEELNRLGINQGDYTVKEGSFKAIKTYNGYIFEFRSQKKAKEIYNHFLSFNKRGVVISDVKGTISNFLSLNKRVINIR